MHSSARFFAISVTLVATASCSGGADETARGYAPQDASADGTPDGSLEAAQGDGPASDTSSDRDVAEAPSQDGEGHDVGADVEGGGETGPGFDYLVPPAAHCAPTGDACSLGPATGGIFASYRKDAFLPKNAYPEGNDDPVHGGRFQIAAVAATGGTVTEVRINGVSVKSLLDDPSVRFEDNPVEWFHVWPTELAGGGPVWVSFHSRDPSWDTATSGQIEVLTSAGTAVSGAFPVAKTTVPITYVTTTTDRSSYLIHVKNTDTVPRQVTRVWVHGRDVTTPDVACIPKTTLAPGETAMWEVPWCTPIEIGSPWTVVVEYAGAPAAVGAGRVIKPHFVVESWNTTSECPFPGAKQDNFLAYQAAGFDTAYHHGGQPDGCEGFDNYEMLNVTAPQTDNFSFLATWELVMEKIPPLTNTDGIAGVSTGDESDGSIYESDEASPDYGKPKAWVKARKSSAVWARHPEVLTFNGGMTNRNIGTFAGMTDVQGIDLYAAACAPHITPAFNHPPLRGPYDYLRNARNNHMPLPTWLYTQGLSSAWNTTQPLTGVKIHVQPDPQELLVQAFSVVAAGGKGIMWFQASQEEAQHAPPRWDAISRANWMVRGVRDILREGDVTGLASGPDDVISEVIRGRDALVLVVINLNHEAAPDDVSCNTNKYISEAAVPHWVLKDYAPTVSVTVPEDFGVHEVFEVRDGGVWDLATAPVVQGRELWFGAVPLSNAVPVRLYVLASDPSVRDRVAAAAQP